jgi:DNA-binding CsgD family transcriptional regulator
MGDPKAATQSLEIAAAGYQRLGADGYLERVNELRQRTAAAAGPKLSLSDRERDVLTLVSAGMSYAQIARDLFITQSTVSYHLGNIYAKANVSSRHQLTALVRSDPTLFGLPQS